METCSDVAAIGNTVISVAAIALIGLFFYLMLR